MFQEALYTGADRCELCCSVVKALQYWKTYVQTSTLYNIDILTAGIHMTGIILKFAK